MQREGSPPPTPPLAAPPPPHRALVLGDPRRRRLDEAAAGVSDHPDDVLCEPRRGAQVAREREHGPKRERRAFRRLVKVGGKRLQRDRRHEHDRLLAVAARGAQQSVQVAAAQLAALQRRRIAAAAAATAAAALSRGRAGRGRDAARVDGKRLLGDLEPRALERAAQLCGVARRAPVRRERAGEARGGVKRVGRPRADRRPRGAREQRVLVEADRAL